MGTGLWDGDRLSQTSLTIFLFRLVLVLLVKVWPSNLVSVKKSDVWLSALVGTIWNILQVKQYFIISIKIAGCYKEWYLKKII